MVTDNHYRWDFIGLSTDEKPTPATSPKVSDGSTYYTSDNSKLYVWYNDQWYEKTATGGGGGDVSTVKMLSTDDYNYPTANPTGIAMWLMPAGTYVAPTTGSVDVYPAYNEEMSIGQGWSSPYIIVSKQPTSSERGEIIVIGDSLFKGGWFDQIDANGRNYTWKNFTDIKNNLTTTLAGSALDARQGAVLKNLIDSLIISGSGAPTSSTAGTIGKLYEDTVNGKLYQCTKATSPYEWKEVGVETVQLENPLVHEYMNIADYSDNPDYTKSVMYDNFYYTHLIQDGQSEYVRSRPFPVTIKFSKQTGVNDYYIYVGEDLQAFHIDITNATGSGANYTYSVSDNTVTFNVYNLFPDREYSYSVYVFTSTTSVRQLIASGKVKTEGQVRMIYASNIYNARDLGGWSTNDGSIIKYGKVYRGSELDGLAGRGLLDNNGMAVFDSLGITSEIDLDGAAAAGAVHLEDYNSFQITAYEAGLTNASSQANYKKIIEKVAENALNGVGTYIHCQAGADRTGTVVVLLEGLLGVNENYIAKDYELSTMNAGVPNVNDPSTTTNTLAYRSYTTYKKMIAWFKETYTGTDYTLNDSIYDYCISIGVSKETIDTLRHEMLDSKVVKQYVTEKDVQDILVDEKRKEAIKVFGEGNFIAVTYDGSSDETWNVNSSLVIDDITRYRFYTSNLSDVYSAFYKNNKTDFAIVSGMPYILGQGGGNAGTVSSGVAIIQAGSAGSYTYAPYVYINPVNPITTVAQFREYLAKYPITIYYPKQPSA